MYFTKLPRHLQIHHKTKHSRSNIVD